MQPLEGAHPVNESPSTSSKSLDEISEKFMKKMIALGEMRREGTLPQIDPATGQPLKVSGQ